MARPSRQIISDRPPLFTRQMLFWRANRARRVPSFHCKSSALLKYGVSECRICIVKFYSTCETKTMKIERIDHFVLTVASIEVACEFYSRVLGMQVVRFESMGTARVALAFGTQKINLHQADAIPDPNVLKPTPGSADFCLITETPVDKVMAHLQREGVGLILGPVVRTGAMGKMISVYVRDPDLNLVEIANYTAA